VQQKDKPTLKESRKIAEIAGELDKPVMVKETGNGHFRNEDAKKLEKANVKAIDVCRCWRAPVLAAVEYFRSEAEIAESYSVFWGGVLGLGHPHSC